MWYRFSFGFIMLHFVLLQADYVNQDLIDLHGDLPDMFSQLLTSIFGDHTLEVFLAYKGELPPADHRPDCFVISGSRCSVNDPLPWINNLSRYAIDAKSRAKLIGFCFGHQLLAKGLGGNVGKRENGGNFGARNVRIASDIKWLSDMGGSRYSLLFNHSEEVKQLPRGCSLIARSDECRIAIFSDNKSILGMQGHPEYTTSYQQAIMNSSGRRLPEEVIDCVEGRNRDFYLSPAFVDIIRRFVVSL